MIELLIVLVVLAVLLGLVPVVLTLKAILWGIFLVIGIVVLVRLLRGERL
jgi:hypothetical protein